MNGSPAGINGGNAITAALHHNVHTRAALYHDAIATTIAATPRSPMPRPSTPPCHANRCHHDAESERHGARTPNVLLNSGHRHCRPALRDSPELLDGVQIGADTAPYTFS
jgi:hypothetical protein